MSTPESAAGEPSLFFTGVEVIKSSRRGREVHFIRKQSKACVWLMDTLVPKQVKRNDWVSSACKIELGGCTEGLKSCYLHTDDLHGTFEYSEPF